MNLLSRLFGGTQKRVTQDELAPLLNGIVRPLQRTAVEKINMALRHIPEGDGQGRFMLLLLHVCLASILQRLNTHKGVSKGKSRAFKEFAISTWDRPPGMSAESDQKLFGYTQQYLGEKLAHPACPLVDVGLTLLSLALPNEEGFATSAAEDCGRAARACWVQASLETDKALGVPLQINFAIAKIDQQVYLMRYDSHYLEVLGDQLTHRRLAELLLFRAWTAQFGYRVYSSDRAASEKLIGETINATKHFGLAAFKLMHGFSIEAELGADFITLIEERWREYDLVISTMLKPERVPVMAVAATLARHLEISDPAITSRLAIDFATQLDFIKRTAQEIGVFGA